MDSRFIRLTEEIRNIIPMDEKKVYLYLRQACLYGKINKMDTDRLQEVFGITDASLIWKILEGAIYQFGFHEYYYISPEKEEELSRVFDALPLNEGMEGKEAVQCLKEVFREKPEAQWQYAVVCWQYIVRRSSAQM